MTRRHWDRYYTPPELAETLIRTLPMHPGESALEPHAGDGAFVDALQRRGVRVHAQDIDPQAPARGRLTPSTRWLHTDYLQSPNPFNRYDWVIGNPPFKEAERHVRKALVGGHNVAFLLRLAFLESKARVAFWAGPGSCLRKLWVLAERPSFTSDGKTDSAAYAFFWWESGFEGEAEIIPGLTWRNTIIGPPAAAAK